MTKKRKAIKKIVLILSSFFVLTGIGVFFFAGPWQPHVFRKNLHKVIPAGDHANISIIGMDDTGELEKEISVQDNVLKQIEKQKPKVVMIFVHGWKHDGSEENLRDGNLHSFKEFIEETSNIFASDPAFKRLGQQNMLGVYIGWNGYSRNFLQDLTFWDRYATASAIGDSSILLKTIFEISDKARSSYPGDKVRVVLIGHSMGGKILNGILNQITNYEADTFNVRMPNLTIIINPAAPINHYDQFVQNYEEKNKERKEIRKTRDIRPKIVSVTSVGDLATSFFYPIGVGEKAIGHGIKVTHELTRLDPKKIDKPGDCFDRNNPFVYNLICNELNDSAVIRINDDLFYELKMLEGVPQTPYWIIQAPEEILKDHNSFFDKSFIAFAGAIFKFAK